MTWDNSCSRASSAKTSSTASTSSPVLPPLREWREDIPALAEHFLRQIGQKQGRSLRLSAEAVDKLLRYPWPGNVRELENAMERTAILAQNDIIAPDDLPFAHRGRRHAPWAERSLLRPAR